MQYDENAEKYGYEDEMTPMKYDNLQSVYIDRTGDWVRSGNDTGKFYLKDEVDTTIAELEDAWCSEHEACEALKAKPAQQALHQQGREMDGQGGNKMKREELVRYDGEWYDANIVDCLLDKNDAEIASLNAENESLKAKLDTVNELVKTSKDLYDHTIESLKASHYADSVDAGMRERRLKRALWMARAFRARDIQRWWLSATLAPITERACRVWNNIEIKCLKKAEEYK